MGIFRQNFAVVSECWHRFSCHRNHKRRLGREARQMRVRYGPQAADIAQEMGADCAQAGALVDALFWLKQAQRLKHPARW